MRKDRLAARSGVAADESFDVHRRLRLQSIVRLFPRQVDDPRNRLWRQFLRVVAVARPQVFVIENVDRFRRSTEFAIKTNQPGEIAKVALLEKNWNTLVDNGFIIAGSPATVADRLIEAAKSLRFGNLHALLQIGSMPHDLTEKNITLFAEEVMPRIRRLWADDGWKHEWWPIGADDRSTV